jgi:hypothetical protein
MLIDLAAAAYNAAYEGDQDEAWNHVAAIARRGGRDLHRALMMWVDNTIAVTEPGQGALPGFGMELDGTGEDINIDEALPEVAWSGRLFAARVAGDVDMWKALLLSAPRDPAGLGRYVMTLLAIMATTAAATDENTGRVACSPPVDNHEDVAAARRAVAHLN